MDHLDAEDRSPRPAGDDDLFLSQTPGQIFRHLDPVLDHSFDRHRRGFAFPVSGERPARAALVPLDEGEISLPAGQTGLGEWTGGDAWPAVKKQNYRIAVIRSGD